MRLTTLGSLFVWASAALPLQAQQGPAGIWNGHWERDGSTLTVEMTFARTLTGFEGSFSSPQLRVVGIPLTTIRYEPPALRWEIVGDATTLVFEGTVRGDTIAGRFQEGPASGTFTLTRARAQPAAVREEEITFANGAVTLSGTIVALEKRTSEFPCASEPRGSRRRISGRPAATWRYSSFRWPITPFAYGRVDPAPGRRPSRGTRSD